MTNVFYDPRPTAVIYGKIDEPTLVLSLEEAVQLLGEELTVASGVYRAFEEGLGTGGLWLIPHPDG